MCSVLVLIISTHSMRSSQYDTIRGTLKYLQFLQFLPEYGNRIGLSSTRHTQRMSQPNTSYFKLIVQTYFRRNTSNRFCFFGVSK